MEEGKGSGKKEGGRSDRQYLEEGELVWELVC